MGIISGIKVGLILLVLAGAGGGFMYVKNLKADLAVSEANNMKLEESVAEQKAVIEQVQADFKKQQEISKKLQEVNSTLAKSSSVSVKTILLSLPNSSSLPVFNLLI